MQKKLHSKTRKKRKNITLTLLIVLILFFACGKEPTSGPQTPTEKVRREIAWLNEVVMLPPDNIAVFSKNLWAGDTINMGIALLNPNKISYLFILDAENYNIWQTGFPFTAVFSEENSNGGNYKIHIPSDDTYYLVIQNTSSTNAIKFQLYTTVIRWVYEQG